MSSRHCRRVFSPVSGGSTVCPQFGLFDAPAAKWTCSQLRAHFTFTHFNNCLKTEKAKMYFISFHVLSFTSWFLRWAYRWAPPPPCVTETFSLVSCRRRSGSVCLCWWSVCVNMLITSLSPVWQRQAPECSTDSPGRNFESGVGRPIIHGFVRISDTTGRVLMIHVVWKPNCQTGQMFSVCVYKCKYKRWVDHVNL